MAHRKTIIDDYGNEVEVPGLEGLSKIATLRPVKLHVELLSETLPDTPNTRMLLAIQRWNANALLEALGSGADPNALFKNATALQLACAQNAPVLVSLLLEHGADPNARDEFGQTALHVAGKVARAAVLRNLFAHKADRDALDAQANTPSHMAAAYGNISALRFLLDKGAMIEARDALGRTPYLCACAAGSLDSACYLAGRGADTLALDNNGQGALAVSSHVGKSFHRKLAFALDNMGLPLCERRRSTRPAL